MKVIISPLVLVGFSPPLEFHIPRATVVVASQLTMRGRKCRHMVTESAPGLIGMWAGLLCDCAVIVCGEK